MLSPFGKEVRKLRLDRDITLRSMAEKLGYSSAFLSAVETWNKAIPAGFVETIIKEYQLSSAAAQALRVAADQSQTKQSLKSLDAHSRSALAGLARELPYMSPKYRNQLIDHIEQFLSKQKKKG